MKKIYFDVLDSTNSYLKDNYEKYENEDVIIANIQTKGRGRFDRKWVSNNDICLSILFKGNNFNHSIISSVAILKTLNDLNIECSIKWPNDIYVNMKKISGVLIETIYESNEKKCDIVGIGLNMNSNEITNSIGILDNVSVDKEYVIDILLNNYRSILSKSMEYIKKIYTNNFLLKNRIVEYNNKNYIVLGITDDFKIILKNDNEILKLSSNEVSLKL